MLYSNDSTKTKEALWHYTKHIIKRWCHLVAFEQLGWIGLNNEPTIFRSNFQSSSGLNKLPSFECMKITRKTPNAIFHLIQFISVCSVLKHLLKTFFFGKKNASYNLFNFFQSYLVYSSHSHDYLYAKIQIDLNVILFYFIIFIIIKISLF